MKIKDEEITQAIDDGLIYVTDDQVIITSAGDQMYLEAVENPFYIEPTFLDWLGEVMTGMTKSGLESDIENPVLPSRTRPPAEYREPRLQRPADEEHERKRAKRYGPRRSRRGGKDLGECPE